MNTLTKRKKLSPAQYIAVGFLLIILVGTLILCLPISSKTGQWTDLLTALFTATSATCVTGLVVVDTFSHWNVLVLFFLANLLCLFEVVNILRIGIFNLNSMQIIVRVSSTLIRNIQIVTSFGLQEKHQRR